MVGLTAWLAILLDFIETLTYYYYKRITNLMCAAALLNAVATGILISARPVKYGATTAITSTPELGLW